MPLGRIQPMRFLLIAPLLLLLTSYPALAQSAYDTISSWMLEEEDWIDVEASSRGQLGEGDSQTFTAYLSGSDYYAIGAICDSDCSSVALAVEGPRFYFAISGEQEAYLSIWIEDAGSYEFTVSVNECSTSFCYWGALAGIDWFMW